MALVHVDHVRLLLLCAPRSCRHRVRSWMDHHMYILRSLKWVFVLDLSVGGGMEAVTVDLVTHTLGAVLITLVKPLTLASCLGHEL